jgi:hypothetical protein
MWHDAFYVLTRKTGAPGMTPTKQQALNFKEWFSMYKTFSLALLVGGVIFIIYGISASQSLSSDISRFFTSTPSDRAIWMLFGGVALFIVGLAGLLRGSKATA